MNTEMSERRSPHRYRPVSIITINHIISARKVLHTQLRRLSDTICALGLFGIVLMIIANEINFYTKKTIDTDLSCLLKWILSFSTICLLALLILYHYLNLKLYAVYNSLDDWRFALTLNRGLLILTEILICAIHPMPRSFPRNWPFNHQQIPVTNHTSTIPSSIAPDIVLSLPMFARIYLITRCILFHSDLFLNAPLRSLGTFNKVSIDLPFLLKTYLDQRPARFLLTFCFLMFFIGSWSIRACDYKPPVAEHISFLHSMWLFAITFTTVGYGDIFPSTYCGRTVVTLIALFGLVLAALLISVIAHKLDLTRWQKYVNKFVQNVNLTRQHRTEAANIIKFSMQIWFLKRRNRTRTYAYLKSQRMLFNSIRSIQKLKQEQRKLNENYFDLADLAHSQRYTTFKIKQMSTDVKLIKLQLDQVEKTLHQLVEKKQY